MPVKFGTPLFDEFTHIRHRILREPLGLTFSCKDIAVEWKDVHLVAWSLKWGVLGGLILHRLSKTEFKMRQVAVLDDFQRRGIGKKMAQFTEQWVLENGGEIISLHARKKAVSFYKKLDYELHPVQFLEVGIPHFKMHKLLRSTM